MSHHPTVTASFAASEPAVSTHAHGSEIARNSLPCRANAGAKNSAFRTNETRKQRAAPTRLGRSADAEAASDGHNGTATPSRAAR